MWAKPAVFMMAKGNWASMFATHFFFLFHSIPSFVDVHFLFSL